MEGHLLLLLLLGGFAFFPLVALFDPNARRNGG
jgi:hypothetical protein